MLWCFVSVETSWVFDFDLECKHFIVDDRCANENFMTFLMRWTSTLFRLICSQQKPLLAQFVSFHDRVMQQTLFSSLLICDNSSIIKSPEKTTTTLISGTSFGKFLCNEWSSFIILTTFNDWAAVSDESMEFSNSKLSNWKVSVAKSLEREKINRTSTGLLMISKTPASLIKLLL